MVFSSYSFLFYFLPILIFAYYMLPKRYRNSILLLFSLGFYAWGGPKYLLVMVLSIIINYLMGLLVYYVRGNNRCENFVVLVTVVANLLLLGYFKYSAFVFENINSIFCTNFEIPEIVLPIGISFYTFQGLSYVIDIRNGKGAVQKNPLKTALYISLFPQLIAGPIVRYESIALELDDREECYDDISRGMERFILGLSKKMLLANAFGKIADSSFALGSGELSIVTAWIGAIAYTLQIYYDFGGYSDMALGLGSVFGFTFPENFNYPYISKSITEFWRRWHISLSSWFRDYVYIPLGGNRCSKARWILNLLVVWTLTGIWHGASWNFVVWGFYYACLLICEKLLSSIVGKIPSAFRYAITMILVIMGWVVFRSDTLSYAIFYIRTMFDVHTNSDIFCMQIVRLLREDGILILTGIICATPIVIKLIRRSCECFNKKVKTVLCYTGYVLLFGACIVRLVVSSYNPFIYFRF